jgi:hypothetical protein
MTPTRDQAWETLTRYTKASAAAARARREASVGWYARHFGEEIVARRRAAQ